MPIPELPASPPVFDADGWHVELGVALGIRAAVYVGDESDIVQADIATTEGVGIAPLGLGVVASRGPFFGELRIEEGTVHAGGVEAAGARLGVRDSAGIASFSAGRSDVEFTSDRTTEPEDRLFSIRPMLSTALLPLHATGGFGTLAWPDRVELRTAVVFTSITSDAPWMIARADVYPLGELPLRAGAGTPGIRFDLGGGVAYQNSPSLGETLGWTADATLAAGPVYLSAGWISGVDSAVRSDGYAELAGRLFPEKAISPLAALRGERATGFGEEDERWLVGGRIQADIRRWHVAPWIEFHHSEETGTGDVPDDVVVLQASAERDNDVLFVGALARW